MYEQLGVRMRSAEENWAECKLVVGVAVLS